MEIGKRIRSLREAKGMSQGDIEKRSGLLRSYISRVEGGYTAPSLGTLEKFAKALDIEPYQLLFRGDGPATAAKVPPQAAHSRTLKQLVRLFEAMPSANRKLLLALAAKLNKLQ
jgi:transcriptional regulator with XRE-family HTH domain